MGWFRADAARASLTEAFQYLRVFCDILRQELQSDKSTEFGVLGFIHRRRSGNVCVAGTSSLFLRSATPNMVAGWGDGDG